LNRKKQRLLTTYYIDLFKSQRSSWSTPNCNVNMLYLVWKADGRFIQIGGLFDTFCCLWTRCANYRSPAPTHGRANNGYATYWRKSRIVPRRHPAFACVPIFLSVKSVWFTLASQVCTGMGPRCWFQTNSQRMAEDCSGHSRCAYAAG
jgi:hypothetical protein